MNGPVRKPVPVTNPALVQPMAEIPFSDRAGSEGVGLSRGESRIGRFPFGPEGKGVRSVGVGIEVRKGIVLYSRN